MAVTPELRQVTQHLRNAAPQQFDEFREAFAAYEATFISALVAATTDVYRVQGQVQICRDLNRMFREIK